MHRTLRSASTWSILASAVQRTHALVLAVLVGQHHGLEPLGQWALGQTLALALLGTVGIALSQVLIAAAPHDRAMRSGFWAALALCLASSTVAVLVLQLVARWWDWDSLRGGALAAVGLYALGGMAYLLACSHLLARDDGPGLRRLALAGVLVLLACVVAAPAAGLWTLAGGTGAAMLCASGLCVGRPEQGPLRGVGGDLLRRGWPLMLGNALVNPALFVSVACVGADGGLAAAALYSIGNQWRNLLLLPLSLLLPVHLRRLARGGGTPRGWMPLGLAAAAVVLAAAAWAPGWLFRLFSSGEAPPETRAVLRAALLSVPLAGLAALGGQRLVALGRQSAAPWINLAWCVVLFLAYWCLRPHGSQALAMTQAHVAASAVACLGVFAACRQRTPP